MEKQGNRNITIGLMGFEFQSPNLGCEALSYAFINYIANYAQEKQINVTIYNWDSELGDVPSHYPGLQFVRVIRQLKDLKCRWIRAIRECDIIFDVTMGDSFSDIYSLDYCKGLIREKRIVQFLNKNYILLPQTYGPFDSVDIRTKAIHVIERAKKVYSRDKTSIDYLTEMGTKKDIQEEIDLAFMLPYNKAKYTVANNGRKNLGINVSGLLWKGGFNSENQFGLKIQYKEYITNIIQEYIKDGEWNVHLIPHVIDMNPNPHDDDWHVIEELHKQYSGTILAPAFSNPIDAKSYISNMNFFIGARMHSTIGAISSGVPVLPVSYSRKFEGLYERLNYNHLIHGKKMSTVEAIEKTKCEIDNLNNIDNEVNNRQVVINQRIEELKNELDHVMEAICKG